MIRLRVRWRVSLGLLSQVLLVFLVPLAVPVALAVLWNEPAMPFLAAMAVTVVLGRGARGLGQDADPQPRDAFLAAALIWLLVAVIGAVPFIVAGVGTVAAPVDALFESMSGVTTTGATVLTDFEQHSRSVLLWRQLLQWLGGLGILILVSTVFADLGVTGTQLLETETWTPTVERLTPQIAETARLLLGVYTVVTLAVAGALWTLHLAGVAPRMDLYNAVAHAMTAVATAGFSPEPLSAAAFTAPAQWVLIAGMLIGGTSFVLLVLTARTGPRRLLRSEEFRVYIGSVTALSVAIALTLVLEGRYAWAGALHHALFNTVSIVTTTGFASADFAQWSAAGTHLLFLGMFLGAMVGSTTCSIKTLRWVIVAKTVRRQLFLAVNPRAVRPVRLDGEPIDEEIIPDALVFVLLSIVLVLLLTVVVVIDTARAGVAVGEFEALGAAAATFLNIGPGFGVAGPFGSYHGFPTPTKVAMIVLMWVGRIEIIPVLVLVTRTFWR